MPEWLTSSFSATPAVPIALLAWRVGFAMVLGAAVALIYRWARRGEVVSPTFVTTLILLATVIAMATQVIGDNVARAFSLVGALSVVRFRTVVKDTQDTAFVIFAVVVGMASGANQLVVALVGVGVIGVGSILLWPRRRGDGWASGESVLSFRVVSDGKAQETLNAILGRSLDRVVLVSVATAKQRTCLDLKYRIRFRRDHQPTHLVSELNLIEGISDVELKRED